MTFIIFSSILVFTLSAFALEPCDEHTSSQQQLRLAIDQTMLGVDESINSNIRETVAESIKSFKLSTEQLAKVDANPEAIVEWYKNINGMKSLAFEALTKKFKGTDQAFLKRTAAIIVDSYVSLWIGSSFQVSSHEAAHCRKYIQYGYRCTFGYGDSQENPNQSLNIGELFLALIKSPNGAYASRISNPGYPYWENTNSSEAEMSAAGINQRTTLGSDIEEDSNRSGQFYILDAIPLAVGKSDIIGYTGDPNDPAGDPYKYANQLILGGQVSRDTKPEKIVSDIHNLSLLTTALSGGTWNSVRAIGNYTTTGDMTVDTLSTEIKGMKVQWPSIATYLNGTSVSVKGTTNVSKPGSTIKSVDLGFEQSVIGGTKARWFNPSTVSDITEVSARVNFNDMGRLKEPYIKTSGNNAGGYGIEAGAAYQLTSDPRDPRKGLYVSGNVKHTKELLESQRECYENISCTNLNIGADYRY